MNESTADKSVVCRISSAHSMAQSTKDKVKSQIESSHPAVEKHFMYLHNPNLSVSSDRQPLNHYNAQLLSTDRGNDIISNQ